MKNKKVVTNYQARNYRGAGGSVSPEKSVAPPWKNVLNIVKNIWAPLSKLFASPGAQSGLGLPIMLATVQQ